MSVPKRILLVEDFEDSRQSLSKLLELEGYTVLEAADGAAAIETAISGRPDLILMDLSLPVVDGLSAAARIRADRSLLKVPIIAVSGHDELEFDERARAAGFADYVTKPIDFAVLLEKVSSYFAEESPAG